MKPKVEPNIRMLTLTTESSCALAVPASCMRMLLVNCFQDPVQIPDRAAHTSFWKSSEGLHDTPGLLTYTRPQDDDVNTSVSALQLRLWQQPTGAARNAEPQEFLRHPPVPACWCSVCPR